MWYEQAMVAMTVQDYIGIDPFGFDCGNGAFGVRSNVYTVGEPYILMAPVDHDICGKGWQCRMNSCREKGDEYWDQRKDSGDCHGEGGMGLPKSNDYWHVSPLPEIS